MISARFFLCISLSFAFCHGLKASETPRTELIKWPSERMGELDAVDQAFLRYYREEGPDKASSTFKKHRQQRRTADEETAFRQFASFSVEQWLELPPKFIDQPHNALSDWSKALANYPGLEELYARAVVGALDFDRTSGFLVPELWSAYLRLNRPPVPDEVEAVARIAGSPDSALSTVDRRIKKASLESRVENRLRHGTGTDWDAIEQLYFHLRVLYGSDLGRLGVIEQFELASTLLGKRMLSGLQARLLVVIASQDKGGPGLESLVALVSRLRLADVKQFLNQAVEFPAVKALHSERGSRPIELARKLSASLPWSFRLSLSEGLVPKSHRLFATVKLVRAVIDWIVDEQGARAAWAFLQDPSLKVYSDLSRWKRDLLSTHAELRDELGVELPEVNEPELNVDESFLPSVETSPPSAPGLRDIRAAALLPEPGDRGLTELLQLAERCHRRAPSTSPRLEEAEMVSLLEQTDLRLVGDWEIAAFGMLFTLRPDLDAGATPMEKKIREWGREPRSWDEIAKMARGDWSEQQLLHSYVRYQLHVLQGMTPTRIKTTSRIIADALEHARAFPDLQLIARAMYWRAGGDDASLIVGGGAMLGIGGAPIRTLRETWRRFVPSPNAARLSELLSVAARVWRDTAMDSIKRKIVLFVNGMLIHFYATEDVPDVSWAEPDPGFWITEFEGALAPVHDAVGARGAPAPEPKPKAKVGHGSTLKKVVCELALATAAMTGLAALAHRLDMSLRSPDEAPTPLQPAPSKRGTETKGGSGTLNPSPNDGPGLKGTSTSTSTGTGAIPAEKTAPAMDDAIKKHGKSIFE